MAETIYFNEPDVIVTSSRITAPWGVYASRDLQSIELEQDMHRRLLRRILLCLAIATYLIGMLIQFINRISELELSMFGFILVGIGILSLIVDVFVFSPIYKVKIRGAFGLVTFDCGDDYRYAKKLAQALTVALDSRNIYLEGTPGVANG